MQNASAVAVVSFPVAIMQRRERTYLEVGGLQKLSANLDQVNLGDIRDS